MRDSTASLQTHGHLAADHTASLPVRDIPWGSHVCHFYSSVEDLIDVHAPYFRTGLEKEELCLWIVPPLLTPDQARQALRPLIPDLDRYVERGQMQFVDSESWYMSGGRLKPIEQIGASWAGKIKEATTRGLEGLRASGGPGELSTQDSDIYCEYERLSNKGVSSLRLKGLCLYWLKVCSVDNLVHAVTNHQRTLVKNHAGWIAVESADHKQAVHLAELQKAQDQLKASEAEYRALFDMSAVGQVESELPAGRFLRVNRRFSEMLGYTAQELLERTFLDITHPEDRAASKAAMDSLLKGDTSEFSLDKRYLRKEGSVMWGRVTVRLVRDKENRPLRAVAAVQDISEQKESEMVLRESEERLRTAVEVGQIGVWDWDIRENRLTWSDRILEIHGVSRRDLGGGVKDFFNTIYPEDRDMVSQALSQTLTGKKPYRLEFRILRPSGEIRWVSTQGRVMFDTDGRPLRMIGATMDVTEPRTVAEEIRRLNAELEMKVAERTRELLSTVQELEAFSYSVSHDLRAPLRGINGFSQAVLDDYGDKLDEDGRRQLERIRAGTERMAQLIDGLLNLARVTRSEITIQDVDMTALAQSAARDLERSQPDRRVQVNIAPGLRTRGDALLLKIVLENLLSNAWKFTAQRADAIIELGALAGDRGQVFFVRDNGAGFDMAYAAKLFGAFQRLHDAAEYPGTGIGLATVRRIVERHGGKVWAESRPDQGAAFYFTIPS